MLELDKAHTVERRLRKMLEERDPDNPALKVIYHSTDAASEAYRQAIFELYRKASELEKEWEDDEYGTL